MLQSAPGLSTIPPMLSKTGHDSREQNGHCESTTAAPSVSLAGPVLTSSDSCSLSVSSTHAVTNSRNPLTTSENLIPTNSSLAKDSNVNHLHRSLPASHFSQASSQHSLHYPRESCTHSFSIGHKPPGHLGHDTYHHYAHHSSHHHNQHHRSYNACHFSHSNSVHSHGYSNTSPTPTSRVQIATHQLQDFMLGQWNQFKRSNLHATLVQARLPSIVSSTSITNCSPSEDSATTSPSPTPQSSTSSADRVLPSSKAPDYNLNGSLPRRQTLAHPEGLAASEFSPSVGNYRRRGGPTCQLPRQSSSDATLWQRGHSSARKTSSPTIFTSRGPTAYACNRPMGQSGYSTAPAQRPSNASPSQAADRFSVNNNAFTPSSSASQGFSGSTPCSSGHVSQSSSLRGSPAHSRPRKAVLDRPVPRECFSPVLTQARVSPQPSRSITPPQSPKGADVQPNSDKPGSDQNTSRNSPSAAPVSCGSIGVTDRSSPTIRHTEDGCASVTLEAKAPGFSTALSCSHSQAIELALPNRMNPDVPMAGPASTCTEQVVSACTEKPITTPMCVNVVPSASVNSSKHDRADTPTTSEQYWTPDPPASPSNGTTLITIPKDDNRKMHEILTALRPKSPDVGVIVTAKIDVPSHPLSPPVSQKSEHTRTTVRLESLNDVD